MWIKYTHNTQAPSEEVLTSVSLCHVITLEFACEFMRKTSRNNISKGSAGSFASSSCYRAELLIDPAEEMMVMAAFGFS